MQTRLGHSLRRIAGGGALVVAAAALASCGGSSGGGPSLLSSGASHKPVTLQFWSPYTGDEKKIYDRSFERFHQKYPWITVKSSGNIDDTKVIRAVAGGVPPDVYLSFGPDYVGRYCTEGTFLDLGPYMQADNVSTSIFPKAALTYSQYGGKTCMLPALTDAYGLYYNKQMLSKAGYSSPPKTMDELLQAAEKTTVKNADGSLKVVGFDPVSGFYEISISAIAHSFGATWFDSSGKATLASDPRWEQAMIWEKKLSDFYGYDNITKFNAQWEDAEFNANNAFESEHLAMNYDGEWRVAFIDEYDKSKVPYATAPFPTQDPSFYGSGQIGGDNVGIPKGAPHPAEAWLLVKFLASDTNNLVHLSNEIKNVPTTFASLKSPDITPNPNFQVFFKVFENPKSSFFPPITASGPAYSDILGNLNSKWLAGKIPQSQLHSELAKAAEQVDSQVTLGNTP